MVGPELIGETEGDVAGSEVVGEVVDGAVVVSEMVGVRGLVYYARLHA